MNTAVANSLDPLAAADDLKLKRFLIYSLILHGLLVLSIAASIYIKFQGEQWGSIGGQEGGAVPVKLVGPPPGIPLPPRPAVAESTTADPTLGNFTPDTALKPLPETQPKKPAEKLPTFKNEKPLPDTHKSKLDKPKNPPPDNAVDYGKGGPAKMPTNYSNQPPGSGAGPIIAKGEGGGDFAAKYGWYIDSVVRRINQTWDQPSIDPAVRAARTAKTVMTFTINRDGSIRNVTMSQSSGNLSMDNAARRALTGVQFGPLPSDFAGSSVDVTFDFDLSLAH